MEDLPVPVMIDILSRLPVKTIIHCKCVCKKWLDLVSDSYFANLHLFRSPAGFMIHHTLVKGKTSYHEPGILKWVEIKDKLDHQYLQHDPVMSLHLNLSPIFQYSRVLPVGSVNGLIFLWQYGFKIDNYFICNPITREYMILPRQKYYKEGYSIIDHGFGVGLQSKEYKVIRIFRGDLNLNPPSTARVRLSEAEVYTLGTGQWRSLGHVPYKISGFYGPFLNGHAHWFAYDNEDSAEKLYAFDFDNETFKLFPSPPVEIVEESPVHFHSLAVLKGCLCQCDAFESQFTIWVMKEYGIKKSWHKEVMIKESISPDLDWLMWEPVYLIEQLCDGTILMVYDEDKLLAYCPERKTVADTDYFHRCFTGMAYRPSFLKLHDFELERVHVL